MKKMELSNLSIQPTKYKYSRSNNAKHYLNEVYKILCAFLGKRNNAKVNKKEEKYQECFSHGRVLPYDTISRSKRMMRIELEQNIATARKLYSQ